MAGNDYSEKATRSRNMPRSDHGLNSSVFHVELYFEHRLKLPFGGLACILGLTNLHNQSP